jgi:D-beta-D-heptose 7-phosphate kinase/D-beta-D-heptose 1-phosphate adenosyltransferase
MNTPLQRPFKILLIGDSCIDEYQYGTIDRISPEAPVPIFKYIRSEEKPGMVYNVKNNLENLGCQVTLLTRDPSVGK